MVVGMVGVVFGLISGMRWAHMSNARSSWSTARAAEVKVKAARKEAREKFWLAWWGAMLGVLAVVGYVMMMMKMAR